MSRLQEVFNAVGRAPTNEEKKAFAEFNKKYADQFSHLRLTPTEWFDIGINPTVDGVYQVVTDHWNSPRYALWKDGYWRRAEGTTYLAERMEDRSILLYEKCHAKWRGVVEKPEWA
jgi:hypothetical protein